MLAAAGGNGAYNLTQGFEGEGVVEDGGDASGGQVLRVPDRGGEGRVRKCRSPSPLAPARILSRRAWIRGACSCSSPARSRSERDCPERGAGSWLRSTPRAGGR